MVNRELWVDYAKAIGIILVVYGHVERGLFASGVTFGEHAHFIIDSMIYSFHMPLFFFLSGLFFLSSIKKRSNIKVVLNKVEVILYPYIVWSLLQGVIEVMVSSHSNNHTTIEQVLALLWAPRAQFWFLYALFLMTLLGILIYRNLAPRFYFLIFAISAALYMLKGFFISIDTNKDFVYIPAIKFVIFNFVFFSLGIFFYHQKKFFFDNNKIIFPSVALVFIVFQWYFHVVLGETLITEKYALALALAIVSIFFISSFSILISKYRIEWLSILGASSMVIFLTHVLITSGIRIFMLEVLKIHDVFIHLILGTAVGVLLPLVAMSFMKQKLQFLFTPPRLLCFKN